MMPTTTSMEVGRTWTELYTAYRIYGHGQIWYMVNNLAVQVGI